MKVKNYEVKELKSGKIEVTVEVEQTADRNPSKDRKFYTGKDVRKFLSSEGHKDLGRLLEDPTVSNFKGPNSAKAKWVFSAKSTSTSPAPAPKKTRKKGITAPALMPWGYKSGDRGCLGAVR